MNEIFGDLSCRAINYKNTKILNVLPILKLK